MSSFRIIEGDCIEAMRGLDDGVAQTCVTSPPYWGLRDYGHDGQLGLEPTPEEYVANLVAVFREVRRVLRDDGTLWLNLGDSYARQGGEGSHGPNAQVGNTRSLEQRRNGTPPSGLKPKDLVGIPWMVAFALRADGWYLRSDIIWAKPNPMPESVTDRPTKAHEYLFLFAKGQWKSRVVALADLRGERVHLGQHVGSHDPNLWADELGVRLATAILDCPELQQNLSLPPLDSKVWHERVDDSNGFRIAGLPVEHRAAAFASRLLASHGTSKEFLCELDRLGVALADHDKFLVCGGSTVFALPPGVNRYGNAAVAIHDTGEIGVLDFSAHTVDCKRPSGCSYFYDADAIREEDLGADNDHRNVLVAPEPSGGLMREHSGLRTVNGRNGAGRNKRTVWTVTTQPFPGAHFATFPPKLIEPCVLAGSAPGDTVLDPFNGAGTTGLVALRHDRDYIGCELNPEYAQMSRDRITDDAPLLNLEAA